MNFEPVIGRLGVMFIVTFKSKTTLARKLSWKENNVKKINDNGRKEKKKRKKKKNNERSKWARCLSISFENDVEYVSWVKRAKIN